MTSKVQTLREKRNVYKVDRENGHIRVNNSDPYDEFIFTDPPASTEKSIIFSYNDAKGIYESLIRVDEKVLDEDEIQQVVSACSNFTRGTLQSVAQQRQKIFGERSACNMRVILECLFAVGLLVFVYQFWDVALWIKLIITAIVILFLLGEICSGSKKLVTFITRQHEQMSDLDCQIGTVLIGTNNQRKKKGKRLGYWINGRHAVWIEFRLRDVSETGL